MTHAAEWLRRFEIVLVIAGVSFLGIAFAATASRRDYQSRQERILFRGNGALPSQPADVAPAVDLREGAEADPLVLGRIEIPRIGVRAIVRDGVDDATLALAVGHVRGTALPGESGNSVLAGHRDTFFRELRKIRIDDRIRLAVPPHIYEYRVVSLEVVDPDETRVLDPTNEESLTLVTCYPFNYIGHAPRRFIVHAARVGLGKGQNSR